MMKTKIIETQKVRILLVDGLPEDAKRFRIEKETRSLAFRMLGMTRSWFREDLPKGNWRPLNFLDKVKEEEAEKIVYQPWVGFYKDYGGIRLFYKTALQSLHSLIEANVKLCNSWGSSEPSAIRFTYYSEYQYACNEWRKEEEKVFHNPLLLIQIN